MPQGWEWDETLFAGSAGYYDRGRLPYPPGLHDVFAAVAAPRASSRLIDVGCGPGTVALMLADLFAEVVGIDADTGMIAEARRLAAERGVAHASWVRMRAEDLPAGLGTFRYATFGQSFHWMEREVVAARIFEMIEPGGAFVHVAGAEIETPAAEHPPPHPQPPAAEIRRLVETYLGAERRAGQGVLRYGTPGNEWGVLRAAGFEAPATAPVTGRQVLDRSPDDVIAHVFSQSGSAPHMFGDRLGEFERDLRALLATASDDGRFSERIPDLALVLYRKPETSGPGLTPSTG